MQPFRGGLSGQFGLEKAIHFARVIWKRVTVFAKNLKIIRFCSNIFVVDQISEYKISKIIAIHVFLFNVHVFLSCLFQ